MLEMTLAEKVRYRIGVLCEDIAEDELSPTQAAQDRCVEFLGGGSHAGRTATTLPAHLNSGRRRY